MAAERVIKTTLALDGEKQYKESLDSAYRSMRVLGSELKAADAAFKNNGGSIDSLRQKNDVLNKQIAQQKEIVESLRKAVADSAAAYGESDKKTDGYRIKLNNATAALSKMEGELNDNQKAIDGFGNDTEKADKKTRNWGESLKKLGSLLGSATATAAKATATAVAAVGAAAGVAAKKIFDISKSTGQFADDLITLSNQTRISTDTLQKWDYASRFVDVSVETMTGSMTKMIRNMDSARNGTGASAEAFRTLGVSITDSSGQLLNSEQVFMTTIDALGRVANETERDALAMAIFGKSAQELNPLIQSGSQELQRLGEEAQKAGLVVGGEALNNMGAFDDAMQRLDAQMQGVGRNIGMIFMPAIQNVVVGAQQMLSDINTALSDGFQPEDVATIGQAIAQKLAEGMQRLNEYLPQIITTVSNVLSQLMNAAVTYLPTLLPMLMNAAIQLLTGALKAIQDNIAKISETVTFIIKAFVKFITDNLPAIIKVAIEVIIALARGMVEAIPQLVAALPQIISAVVEGLLSGIPKLMDVGVQLVKGIWEGIKSMASWFSEKVTGWFNGAVGWIKDLLGIHSPSRLMADVIGRPMGEGVAVGIMSAQKDVQDAMGALVPKSASAINLRARVAAYDAVSGTASMRGVSRAGGSPYGAVDLSDAAVSRIAGALRSAIDAQGDTVLMLNDREMARFVRGVSFA